MKCSTTALKTCFSNKLYQKALIDYVIENKFKYLLYSILLFIPTVCLIFYAYSYGLSIATIRNIILIVIVVLVLYLVIEIIYKMNKASALICNAVGIKNLKRSIELIMLSKTDFEPTTERDIELVEKLYKLEGEMP